MATTTFSQAATLPPIPSLVTSRAYIRKQEQSDIYENKHFFHDARDASAELKAMLVYNKDSSKRYALLFDCPTPANPGTTTFSDSDVTETFDGIVKSPSAVDATWTTGTKVRFTTDSGIVPSPLVADKDYFIYEVEIDGIGFVTRVCHTYKDCLTGNYIKDFVLGAGSETYTMHVNDWIEFVIPVSAQAHASLDFGELGWEMKNGIFVMGSTSDTSFATAGNNFIFSAVYGTK